MNKMTLPNAVLLGEATFLLNEGRHVIIPTKGNSMLPFIIGEKDCVKLIKKKEIQVGDIVLVHLNDGRYVLHRIWSIDADNVTLMGDGNIRGRESCKTQDICGTVCEIIKGKGKTVDVSSRPFIWKSSIWRILLPFRRIILAIYKRVFI